MRSQKYLKFYCQFSTRLRDDFNTKKQSKLLIIKLRTKKLFDWSNANSLKLFTHPLHAAFFGCSLQVCFLLLAFSFWQRIF